MTMTNAQAALQAAATVYSGGRGHATPASVKQLAESFQNWLDHQAQPPAAQSPAAKLAQAVFSNGGYVREWRLLMRPRNTHKDWFPVWVQACDQEEALSKALSHYPGHAWCALEPAQYSHHISCGTRRTPPAPCSCTPTLI